MDGKPAHLGRLWLIEDRLFSERTPIETRNSLKAGIMQKGPHDFCRLARTQTRIISSI